VKQHTRTVDGVNRGSDEVKTYPTEDEVVLTGKASGGIEHA